MRLTTSDLTQMHKSEPIQESRPESSPEQPELNFKTTNKPRRPATDAMISYLKDLLHQRMPDFDLANEDNRAYFESVVEQGFDRVSQAIDKLKAMPVLTQSKTPNLPPQPNRYSGRCGYCGVQVGSQEGIIRKLDSGKWQVYHKEEDCPLAEYPFPYGRYAVPTDEGHLAFYLAAVEGFFLQHGSELSLLPDKTALAIIKKIAEDPREASIRYGLELGHCGRCGRQLTNEESRQAGIGPICADKEGWA